jgi:hypothetical protein
MPHTRCMPPTLCRGTVTRSPSVGVRGSSKAVSSRRSYKTSDETEIARLTRELNEALER